MDKLDLFMKIEYIVHKQHLILSKKLKKYDLTPEQGAILFFLKNKDRINQRMLANLFHISMASLSVRLQRLEKEGYIERIEDEKDRRILWVILTDKGQDMVHYAYKELKDVLDLTFDGMNEEEASILQAYLKHMILNLKKGEEQLC